MGDRFDKLLAMSFHDKAAEIDSQLTDIAHKISCEFYLLKPEIWDHGVLASGTSPILPNLAKHYGCVQMVSSTNANSGYRYYLGAGASATLFGGEKTTLIFKTGTLSISATSVMRFGWTKSADHNAATDQAALQLTGDSLAGLTSKASANSTTGTTYTVSAATWYRAVITVNANATSVLFELYADDSDTLLWSDTLATNIPLLSMYHGVIAYDTGTTSVNICSLDYMDIVTANSRRV